MSKRRQKAWKHHQKQFEEQRTQALKASQSASSIPGTYNDADVNRLAMKLREKWRYEGNCKNLQFGNTLAEHNEGVANHMRRENIRLSRQAAEDSLQALGMVRAL